MPSTSNEAAVIYPPLNPLSALLWGGGGGLLTSIQLDRSYRGMTAFPLLYGHMCLQHVVRFRFICHKMLPDTGIQSVLIRFELCDKYEYT